MFRADPIREQLRQVWLAALFLGAVLISSAVWQAFKPYFPDVDTKTPPTSVSWTVIVGLILLAGGYLAIRDHVYRPFVTLAREVPDAADIWRLIGRAMLSGLSWAPVMSIGLGVLYFDGGGFWTVLQIGALVLLWEVVQRRARPAINRIVGDILPGPDIRT